MNAVNNSSIIGSGGMSRRAFLRGVGILAFGAIVPRTWAAGGGAKSGQNVLIIGDSMALCGFGQRLDSRFRSSGAREVFTYMACGTQPLSWTTLKGYAGAKSRCGYWTIESRKSGGVPETFQDTYGMTRGHKPSSHDVPKIETLLPATHPDILVVQLGNNLFDVLKGKNARQKEVLQQYIGPFLAKVAQSAPWLKQTYWVTPPVCGSLSKDAQDALVAQLRANESKTLKVIDSRELITQPYKNLQADKQHFFGESMTEWADKVFAAIQNDMSRGFSGGASVAEPAAALAVVPPPPIAKEPEPTLFAECCLESMAIPYTNTEIAPYNESLVAFVYRVRNVLKGDFKGEHIVVLHAAHVGGKRQPMHRYFLSQTRTLRLIPIEETPWATLKAKDDRRFLDLERFICEEDHLKLRKQS